MKPLQLLRRTPICGYRLWRHPLYIAAFVLVMLFQLWPISQGGPGVTAPVLWPDWLDGSMNLFHLWWMREAVQEGLWPYVIPYLHHPVGASVYWTTLAPIKTMWGVVLLPLFHNDPYLAYDTLLFGTFVVSCYTTWLLFSYLATSVTRKLWRADIAAFCGAFVVTLSAYIICNVPRHINLASIEGIPLVILFYYRFKDTGKKHFAYAAGASIFYVGFCDFYYLFFLAFFMVADVLYEALKKRSSLFHISFWKQISVRRSLDCGLMCFIFLLPLAAILLPQLFPSPINPEYNDNGYFIEPLTLFLPHEFSVWYPYLPLGVQSFIKQFATGSSGALGGMFLGISTTAIAAFAVLKNITHARRLFWIGSFFLSITFGSFLSFNGDVMLHTWIPCTILAAFFFFLRGRMPFALELAVIFLSMAAYDIAFGVRISGEIVTMKVPMPYLIFKNLVPFFSRGGYPYRFILVTFIALGACFTLTVAYGLESIHRRSLAVVLVIAAFLAPNLEFMRRPIAHAYFRPLPPGIAQRIASEPSDIAVLTDNAPAAQYEVMLHRHPISYARQSRIPLAEYMIFERGVFQQLLRGDNVVIDDNGVSEISGYIKQHQFKYAIFHGLSPVRENFFENVMHARTLHKDPYFQIYQLYD